MLDEVVRRSSGTLSAIELRDPRLEGVDRLTRVASKPGAHVTSVAVNGKRVDVTVVAPEEEWWVVLSVDSHHLTFVAVFEPPRPFAGVEGGRAVILNGPSSAGKSTAMSAVLASSSTPWVMFDELSFGTVAMPFLIWGDRAPTLRPGFLAGIEALAAAGNQVITTGGGAQEFQSLRAHVPTLAVGLDCPLTVRAARQASRSDRWGGLTEASEDRHAGWVYDVRFDTSVLPPEEIATRILRAVEAL